jgi:hypothetical protein
MRMKAFGTILLVFILVSCRCVTLSPTSAELLYNPLGTSVLQATKLVILEYPDGLPDGFPGEKYKELLQKYNYPHLFSVLSPYLVQIKKLEKGFVVRIYDDRVRILTDWSETRTRIDCWCYKGECKNDWLHDDRVFMILSSYAVYIGEKRSEQGGVAYGRKI